MRLSLNPSTDPSDYPFSHRVRTRFCETDAMGIVHHASYLAYLEEARVAYLRHIGHPYEALRAEGVDIAVLEVFARYRRPLRFDELVDVHLVLGAASPMTFQLAYLLTVGSQVRATAVTVHGCVGGDGRARRPPAWARPAVS